MKVEQFLHANQFHIYDTKKAVDYLQSYNSTVVKIEVKTSQKIGQTSRYIITLGRDWDYSKTTSSHVFAFLETFGNVYFMTNNKRKEVKDMIKEGKILYDEGLE